MMRSPKSHISDLKNRSIQGLINEQKRLEEKIKEIECRPPNGALKIHPSPEVRKSMYAEYIDEINKMIEWKEKLLRIKEITITLGKYIYKIDENSIRYLKKQNENEANLIEVKSINISKEEFDFFINEACECMYDWEKKEYNNECDTELDEEVNEFLKELNFEFNNTFTQDSIKIDSNKKDYYARQKYIDRVWEILLKLDTNEEIIFKGDNKYPSDWSCFYNELYLFVERTNVEDYDVAIMKAVIYYTIATKLQVNWKTIKYDQFILLPDFQQRIEQLPLGHLAKTHFNYTKSLNNNLYKKVIIETTKMIDLFYNDFQDESNKILIENEIDNLVSKVVEHYKDVKMKRMSYNCKEEMEESAEFEEEIQKNIVEENNIVIPTDEELIQSLYNILDANIDENNEQ